MKIKLCGFKEEGSTLAAIKAGADFIGFVFNENSPRNIDLNAAEKLVKIIPQNVDRVAVVVDVEMVFLEQIIAKISPNYIQFHGNEAIEFLEKFRQKFPQIKIIKAFKIAAKEDLQRVQDFKNIADLFLFDGKNPGGGLAFDWNILREFNCAKSWFLAGGLNINNIKEALEKTGAPMVDISSGIEEIRGEKSPKLIKQLMEELKKIC